MAAEEKNLYQGGASNIMYTDRRTLYLPDSYTKELVKNATIFYSMASNFQRLDNLTDPMFKMFQHTPKWRRQYIQVNDSGDVTTAADNAEDAVTISPTTSVGMPTTFTAAIENFKCDVYASSTPTAVGGKPKGACLGTVVITTFTNSTTVGVKNFNSASFDIPQYGLLEVVGTGFGEGSESPEATHDDLDKVWNQCGIHRTSVKITDVLKNAKLRGYPNEYNRLVKEAGITHKIQLARDLLFSSSPLGTNLTGTDTFADGTRTDKNGNVIRSTYGAYKAVRDYGVIDTTNDDQNIFSINEAKFNYNNLAEMSEKFFRYSMDKVMPVFAGIKMFTFWSKFANNYTKNGISLGKTETNKLGFKFNELITPNGSLMLYREPAFTESPYAHSGFAPTMENIFHAVYEPPKYERDIKKDNNPLYQKDEYISQEGMGMQLLPTHKIIDLV